MKANICSSESLIAELFFYCLSESSGRGDSVTESSHGRKKGMVLPFEPHSITFDDIVYSVDMPAVRFTRSDTFGIWISN